MEENDVFLNIWYYNEDESVVSSYNSTYVSKIISEDLKGQDNKWLQDENKTWNKNKIAKSRWIWYMRMICKATTLKF